MLDASRVGDMMGGGVGSRWSKAERSRVQEGPGRPEDVERRSNEAN